MLTTRLVQREAQIFWPSKAPSWLWVVLLVLMNVAPASSFAHEAPHFHRHSSPGIGVFDPGVGVVDPGTIYRPGPAPDLGLVDPGRTYHQFMTSCVKDIETAFSEGVFATYRKSNGDLDEAPTVRRRFIIPKGLRLPPDNEKVTTPSAKSFYGGLFRHVESIARITGTGDGLWLVMARQAKGDLFHSSMRAPFYVMQYDRGDRLGYTRAYKKRDKTKHIGGMQALGNMVAMPIECDGDCADRVEFWDFSNPLDPAIIHTLLLPEDADDIVFGENKGVNAHWVAVTHLKEGHLLLMVNRGDNGLTDAFVTLEADRPLHANTTWERFPPFKINVERWNFGAGTFQNVNFLRACGTQNQGLYLLGMRQRGTRGWNQWRSDNQVELYRADVSVAIDGVEGDGQIELSFVTQAQFGQFGDYCEMRGGSSVYVDLNYRPIVYCSAGQSTSVVGCGDCLSGADGERVSPDHHSLKVSEFTPLED